MAQHEINNKFNQEATSIGGESCIEPGEVPTQELTKELTKASGEIKSVSLKIFDPDGIANTPADIYQSITELHLGANGSETLIIALSYLPGFPGIS